MKRDYESATDEGNRAVNVVKTRLLLLPGALLALALLIAGCESMTEDPQTGERPNIVFILTDDMAKDDLEVMSETRRLLGDEGVEFSNAFVTYSLCCPSRATILRGQYAHNHRIIGNFEPYGGSDKFRELGHDDSTIRSAVPPRTGQNKMTLLARLSRNDVSLA